VDINTSSQVTATHIAGATTNTLMKSNATGNMVNSTVTDDGTTVTSSATGGVKTSAAGAPLTLTEGTAPGGVASAAVIYADSTAHRVSVKNNNGSATPTATTSGSLTNGNCAKFDASGNIVDAGAACGTGSGGGGGGANFRTSFTAQTTVTVLGSTHNYGTKNIIAACYDNSSPAKVVQPSLITIDGTTFDVVITFGVAQTGYCVLNASGPPKFASTFATSTSVTISGATHGLQSADLQVTVWDSATGTRKRIEPQSVTVDSTTFDVTVTFATSQSGRIVIQ